MSGKGSSPRPYSVTQDEFANNWDRIFKKPSPQEVDDDTLEKEEFETLDKLNKLRDNNNTHR